MIISKGKTHLLFFFLAYTIIGDREFKPRFSPLRELDNVIEYKDHGKEKKYILIEQ